MRRERDRARLRDGGPFVLLRSQPVLGAGLELVDLGPNLGDEIERQDILQHHIPLLVEVSGLLIGEGSVRAGRHRPLEVRVPGMANQAAQLADVAGHDSSNSNSAVARMSADDAPTSSTN